jgi:hypothetical protein
MRSAHFYVLRPSGNPTPEPDREAWARWMQGHPREILVGYSHIGRLTVSTVFLGQNQNPDPDGDPVLWETLVCGPFPIGQRRCNGNREQAEAMHAEAIGKVMRALGKEPKAADV